MSDFLTGLLPEVTAEWQARSKAKIYRRDPEAWVADVLDSRWHRKQREVVAGYLAHPRNLVKSGNGSGKSRLVAELICWEIATHALGDVLCIASAPTLRQVEQVTFGYLKHNYSIAKLAGRKFPGEINDSLEWIYREGPRDPKKTLVLGLKPSDRDIVGTFQGIRAIGDNGTSTRVFMDEAGGVPQGLFTAAEAVTTGAGNGICGIGNPDRVGTEFHAQFVKGEAASGWKLHTISVLDLPTITGEIVYPDDPEKQWQMIHKSGMNDQAWVDQAALAWGVDSARYKSKVLGEFPDVDDFCFFAQEDIDRGRDTIVISDQLMPVVTGFDPARYGDDDSVLYDSDYGVNEDGEPAARVRFVAEWAKTNTLESVTRGHDHAIEVGARDLVIDSAGLGGPMMDTMLARAETYNVIGANGAEAPSDKTRWLNARAEWYDRFREGLRRRLIDLDPEDAELAEEALAIQFEFTDRGQIKIESKRDMKKRGVKSPNRLDAAVYSYIDALQTVPGAAEGIRKGDVVMYDPMEAYYDPAGMPI
jgi:hypothetical protein